MAGAEGTGLTPWATLAVQDLRAPWPAVFQASELLRADPKKMNPRVEKWCPGPRAEFSTLVPGSKPPRALFGLTVLTQGWTDTPQVHQLALCSASTFGSSPHRGHRQKRKSQVTWQMGHSVRILKWAKFLQWGSTLGAQSKRFLLDEFGQAWDSPQVPSACTQESQQNGRGHLLSGWEW